MTLIHSLMVGMISALEEHCTQERRMGRNVTRVQTGC